jgi:putative phage-type endonuclease
VIQGDDEWRAVKAGRISGSRFGAVLALNKRTGEPNKPRRDLIANLRQELATGVLTEVEDNEYMAHGRRCEPLAVAAYEFLRDCTVQHAAWIPHPTLPYIGFSPDGLVGEPGMVEAKCPFVEARHIRTVESQRCPEDYLAQCQGGMWICGREWCDFISYFPSISVEIVRVYRDEKFIERLAAECAAVWSEVIAQQEAA